MDVCRPNITIDKMKDWFNLEGWIIEDGVQGGRHLKVKFNLKSNSSK